MLIDDKINWKQHISFVCSRVARNSGIFFKLRHYLTPLQLRQIYFNLINPYISYAIVAWGSAFKSNLKKLQVKQNHIARTIFFATLYGKDTESALPLLNLLDILTIENTFKFQALKFIHNWHIKKLPYIFTNSFTYAKDIHSYNTRYASKDNIHKVRTRTNIGKQLHWPLNFGKNYQLISKTLAQTVLVNKLNSIYYVSNLTFKDHFKIGLSFFPLCFIVF